MTEEKNLGFFFQVETAADIASFLTEFAQVQRAVHNHDRANRAEKIRNEMYSQQAHHL